ncbi:MULTISPECIES: antitoxin [unclassified Bartonella]|uniref:type II toxin-antitoxin system RelB family antitoxin n=1 Tax=unclassified Bartonella TaxID=2645622 RepID=UPI0035CEAC31
MNNIAKSNYLQYSGIKRTYVIKITLSLLISEFETIEQESSYTAWLCDKVARSLANPYPPIPHDEVMAEMEVIISQLEAEQKK